MPASRAASSRTKVPKTSVWMNSPGDSIERSTWDSAAKLTTASQPSIAARDGVAVGDVALDQLDAVRVEALEVLAPARVGELVEHADRVARVRLEAVAHVGRADEAGAAGDQEPHAAASQRSRSARYSAQALLPVGQRDRVGALACRAPSRRAGAPGGRASRWSPAITRHSTPGLVEDLLRELVPRARARRRRCGGCRTPRPRSAPRCASAEVARVGRAADLVGDDQHLGCSRAEPQHRLDEVLARRAPNSQEERTMKCRGLATATEVSPASFERP